MTDENKFINPSKKTEKAKDDKQKKQEKTDFLAAGKRWFTFTVACVIAFLGFQHAFGGIWIALFPRLEPFYHLQIDNTVLFYFGAAAVLIALERVTKFSFGKDGITAELEAVKQKLEENTGKLTDVVETTRENQIAIVGGIGGKQSVPDDREISRRTATTEEGPVANTEPVSRPAIDPEDLRKGQFGGKSERDGLRLSACVTPSKGDPGNFLVKLLVSPVGGHAPIIGKVAFYLHDSFLKPIVTVNARNGIAELERVAYGAFTVGAVVVGEDVELELDLAEDTSFPEEFRGN